MFYTSIIWPVDLWFGTLSDIYQDSFMDFVWATQFILLIQSVKNTMKYKGRGVTKRGRWHEWCLIFLTKNITRMKNDTPWIHCSDKDCNENWFEHNQLHSHYTLWIVIFSSSSEVAPILHWLISLLHSSTSNYSQNILDINEPLEKASNKHFKIDPWVLIPMTGQEEILFAVIKLC